MIVLDTNVLSEVLRPAADPNVVTWLAAQPIGSLFVTTVTQAEILYGLALLPSGHRQKRLREAVDAMFEEEFHGRLLSFDESAAREFAAIAAKRRALGRPISQFDAQIAAIARSRNADLATRNIEDFAECALSVINPWHK